MYLPFFIFNLHDSRVGSRVSFLWPKFSPFVGALLIFSMYEYHIITSPKLKLQSWLVTDLLAWFLPDKNVFVRVR